MERRGDDAMGGEGIVSVRERVDVSMGVTVSVDVGVSVVRVNKLIQGRIAGWRKTK